MEDVESRVEAGIEYDIAVGSKENHVEHGILFLIVAHEKSPQHELAAHASFVSPSSLLG